MIHQALTGQPTGGTDTYRKAERVLQALDLTYDPFWDMSESAAAGGGTVTARAYSRIRSAITDVPRCFILNTTDAPAGARWEVDHESKYRYDTSVSGRVAFNDAGPGSRVVYYSTDKSTTDRQHFVAHAEVHYIASSWTAPWEARITDYEAFNDPVPSSGVHLTGWNRQNAITEVTWDTYRALLALGGVASGSAPPTARGDRGGDIVAERVSEGFLISEAPALEVPDDLPVGPLPSRDARRPHYVATSDGVVAEGDAPTKKRTPGDRKRDKVAEVRAVQIARSALEAAGWTLTRDRQLDGVGYDLEFVKAARRLNVEVKGIQGRGLAFNLTPKEWWRAATDDAWVVVAVTSVLSPRAYAVHLLPRDVVLSADRVVTGYRVTPSI